jgi:hypothetical protein
MFKLSQRALAPLLNVGLWTSFSSFPCFETFIRGIAALPLSSQPPKEISTKPEKKEKRT